ncbi:MAG: diaminopimelate decarboxylase [Bacteroidetes bacterium]|jgi:diaminopimelate decarboxylase|nr:diaminopimelate decarboxylase [Bacteroidota bacterium]MBK9302279.1 diaminopimelate decarboxylase [Bacteroidota bacterium]MBK9480399.1 diaminopimelate decarboxylase [Bacteroidota bacterium]HMT36396.1 diaminopimelate decarboxylase [Chitinophagaceae bacterium]
MISREHLIEMAKTYGTPLYIYQREKIEGQYKKLTNAFKQTPTRFFYACKALSNINVLKIIQKLGAGLDTVSINEVHLGLKAGFAPQQILFTPNCVHFSEIEQAKELGVHINIDNISILEQFGNTYGDSYPIMVRLNPHIMAGGNLKISTGHIDSKFGISIHQLRHIERIVKTTKLNVEGLHMHTGSEIKDVNVFLQGLEIMLDLATHFPNIKYLDLGSGFKVPYAPDEKATDVDLLGQKMHETLVAFKKETGKELEIWFEPGKYLVSESGYFIARVNTVKQTPATVFAGIDTGFNHLIRPMFYESYHHIINLSNPKGVERIYTVVGNLCETDTFCWDRVLNEVREGDYLMFKNAGAYGFEMASSFNSRMRPAEILFSKGKHHLIRKRETLDDLLTNQVEIL